MRTHYDIAICGMGPVGAAASILFARAGLTVAVFEQAEDVYPLPRAVGMDGEVVRAFQALGLGEALNSHLQHKRDDDGAGFANSKRQWMFGQKSTKQFGINGWPPMSMFDQPEIEHFLRDIAASLENVDIFLGHSLDSFADSGQQVNLSATQIATGNTINTGATYLVACDGAASPTRKKLGIEWDDLGYDHDWLVVDIVVNDNHMLTNKTLQVCDPDRITTFVATKDPYRRWEWKLNDGETWDEMLEDEKIFSLIDPWTPRGTYELRRKAVYQFHAATARRWREGRVFIAGDAAHQTPPFLGQGMNAGMRDVINLAWKLPMVINGMADDSLLDTYATERIPHAQDLVEWAVALGKLMDHLAEVEQAERDGRDAPATPANQQSAGYGQGREAPPLRDGILMVDQVSDDGSTGYLFSQPIVKNAAGEEFKLDEKLGQGFAMVFRDQVPAFDAATADFIARLGMNMVSISDLTEVKGHFDRSLQTAEAVIVRPDRYVFGHTTDDCGAAALIDALRGKLNLTAL